MIWHLLCIWTFLIVFEQCFSNHIGTGLNDSVHSHAVQSVLYAPLNLSCSVPICEGPLSPIYCSGRLIETTWRLGMQAVCPGPKLKFAAETVTQNFNRLEYPISKEVFQNFCIENFDSMSYLELATLPDFVEEPQFLQRIKDERIRAFAKQVHGRWSLLARKFVPEVRTLRSRFPVLPVPNPFIVPGGFFQVYFYWDSYWIMKGLLVSNMTTTVRGMIANFAFVVDYHGFIPNSGNIQLSRRSQPPLFTQMVSDYYNATRDIAYLKQMLPTVEKELLWWKNNRSVEVEDANGDKRILYQYKAITNCPRPENFLVDVENGEKGSYSPEEIWSSTASACESGWDFSSRWFDSVGSRAFSKYSIRTNTLVPVDLNAFMAWNFKTMSALMSAAGNETKSRQYMEYYNEISQSIELLWNKDVGVWQDYDINKKSHRNYFYPSNVFPLLALDVSPERRTQIARYVNSTGVLNYAGGIPSTLPVNSSQQWDFPNVWAPNVHLFVISLMNSGDKWLDSQALSAAGRFVTTVYNGLINPIANSTSGLWEKYDARFGDGRSGGGGEYVVQEGFGWTNGAVLHLIDTILREEGEALLSKHSLSDELFGGSSHLLIVLSISILLIIMAIWFIICGLTNSVLCCSKLPVYDRERSTSRHLLSDTEDSE